MRKLDNAVRKAVAEEFDALEDQRDSLADFVRDEVGTTCKVRRSGRPQWSCRDERDSAVQALTTGAQPHPGPRWGIEPGTDTRAWTEKAAAGRNLCLRCKAADLLARALGDQDAPGSGTS
jgi:hypothetical protein